MALVPKHILADETVNVGFGTIIILKLAVFEQVPTVPTTVPVPTKFGGTAVPIILAALVAFTVKPVKPVQL